MAFNWAEPIKKSGEEWTPLPEEIEVKADLNGRHDAPDPEPLIQSILELGQLQPVIIRREGGRPVLLAGFNRWRAILTINKEGRTGPMRPDASVPMRVRAVVRNINEEDGFFSNIAENNIRTQTSDLDDAYNLKRLTEGYGLSEEEAAAKYGKSVKWVRKTLQLVQLSKAAQKAYREGRLQGPQAKALAKLSSDAQNAAAAKDGRITPADVREAAGRPVKGKNKPSADALSKLAASLAEAVVDLTVDRGDLVALAEKYLKKAGK